VLQWVAFRSAIWKHRCCGIDRSLPRNCLDDGGHGAATAALLNVSTLTRAHLRVHGRLSYVVPSSLLPGCSLRGSQDTHARASWWLFLCPIRAWCRSIPTARRTVRPGTFLALPPGRHSASLEVRACLLPAPRLHSGCLAEPATAVRDAALRSHAVALRASLGWPRYAVARGVAVSPATRGQQHRTAVSESPRLQALPLRCLDRAGFSGGEWELPPAAGTAVPHPPHLSRACDLFQIRCRAWFQMTWLQDRALLSWR